MLDLRRLEILHRFAARGTITATAADLGYSPSAISQQLAVLEREAGVALLERTAQRASLTDAGRELAEHAGRILAAAEAAASRMRVRAGTVAGRVALSCIPGLAPVLAPHLATLQRDHPGLSIVAHETGALTAAAAVLDRSYDLAVIDHWAAEPPAQVSGLVAHQLHTEEIVMAVPVGHGLAARPGPVTAARLRDAVREETWLCAPPGRLSRLAGDERLAAADASPLRRWEFEGLHVQAAVVATGAGLALLPAELAAEHATIKALPLSPRMHRSIQALTRRTASEDPAINACLHAARRALDGR
ncbi:LysR family transcriptional regulator [Streptomyces sp. NPDC060205]|uniref:LysR substrate-binding domain-containing protein n=1 Tax=Streptomyces sp. NPDC060205 TaxID=3347072 RepID=UPI003658B455